MWARTPFVDDLGGRPTNYDPRDLVCLLTRLRALVNERWPGAGVTLKTRALPDPMGTRVCVELQDVPDHGESEYASSVRERDDESRSPAMDVLPPTEPQSPFAVRSADGSSRVLGTRGTTRAFAVLPVDEENAQLAQWVDDILNSLPDMALAFTAREREDLPEWYQLMILRFQDAKLKAAGVNPQLMSPFGTWPRSPFTAARGEFSPSPVPSSVEGPEKAREVNHVGRDPAIGESGPLHWYVHKSAYDSDLPVRIEEFMRNLYRCGVIVSTPPVAEKFGLEVLQTTRDGAMCLARRRGALQRAARGEYTDPRVLLLSVAAPA